MIAICTNLVNSCCLVPRYIVFILMFDLPMVFILNSYPHRHMSPSDITSIQDALLRKCMNYGRVVHIVVDKRSLFVSAFPTCVFHLTRAYTLCNI